MNKIYQNTIFCVLFATFSISFFVLGVHKVSADEVSLRVSPPLIKIEAKPPADIHSPIIIENMSDNSVNLSIVLKRFTATNKENGELQYLPDKTASGTADPLLSDKIYIVDGKFAIDSLELGPKQKKKLELRVLLPKKTPASDYYFSVLFITNKEAEHEMNTLGIQEGIGVNVLLSINPTKQVQGYIDEFSAPFYSESGPIPFRVRVENPGNYLISPKGVILIKNMFGQTIGRVDLPTTNILAGTTRGMRDTSQKEYAPTKKNKSAPTVVWSEKFLLGYYSANLSLALSDTGPIYTRKIDFIVIPSKILLGTIIAILIVIFITFRVRQKLAK
jgi:hypothetical protein